MRGLKHVAHNRLNKAFDVAPLAGAWIETLMTKSMEWQYIVAPLAGAWIETPPF